MSSIKFNYKIYNNIIEIYPEDGVKDNSLYEIKIKNLHDYAGIKVPLDDLEVKVTTELTPSYCTIEAVRTIMDRKEVSDHDILFYIREASQFADYASGMEYNKDDVPYYVRQFVKYRAAYDSLLKFYMTRASEAGDKGAISEVSFEYGNRFSDISDLLESLKEEVDRWENHVRGFGFQGRAAPQAGKKGSGFYDTYVFNYQRKLTDERSRRHAVDRRRY